jgi:hypothetical protein
VEPEQLLGILNTLQSHINAGFEEAKAMIVSKTADATGVIEEHPEVDTEADATGWITSALDAPLPDGAFEPINQLTGISYRWPDGNIDLYDSFDVYEGTGGLAPDQYAIAHKSNGEQIGFALGPQGETRRGITYFQLTDDYATSNELISYIRGGGKSGKGGFDPADPIPTAYASFKTEPLAHRVRGKWDRLGVVVKTDDVAAMLAHTAIQARLRGIA